MGLHNRCVKIQCAGMGSHHRVHVRSHHSRAYSKACPSPLLLPPPPPWPLPPWALLTCTAPSLCTLTLHHQPPFCNPSPPPPLAPPSPGPPPSPVQPLHERLLTRRDGHAVLPAHRHRRRRHAALLPHQAATHGGHGQQAGSSGLLLHTHAAGLSAAAGAGSCSRGGGREGEKEGGTGGTAGRRGASVSRCVRTYT